MEKIKFKFTEGDEVYHPKHGKAFIINKGLYYYNQFMPVTKEYNSYNLPYVAGYRIFLEKSEKIITCYQSETN